MSFIVARASTKPVFAFNIRFLMLNGMSTRRLGKPIQIPVFLTVFFGSMRSHFPSSPGVPLSKVELPSDFLLVLIDSGFHAVSLFIHLWFYVLGPAFCFHLTAQLECGRFTIIPTPFTWLVSDLVSIQTCLCSSFVALLLSLWVTELMQLLCSNYKNSKRCWADFQGLLREWSLAVASGDIPED